MAIPCERTFCNERFERLTFMISKPLPPPAGYSDWLEYAVETFDTRDLHLQSMFDTMVDEKAVELNRNEIRESARLELRELREVAARSRPLGL